MGVKTEQSEIENPDADSDLGDSSDEEKQADVKQESDIKQEVKTDPDGNPLPKKLESGQHENETLTEFKDRKKSVDWMSIEDVTMTKVLKLTRNATKRGG